MNFNKDNARNAVLKRLPKLQDARKLASITNLEKRKNKRKARIEKMEEMRQSGMTLAAVGKKFGLTRERIRQLTTPHRAYRTIRQERICKCGALFTCREKSKTRSCSRKCADGFRIISFFGKRLKEFTPEDWKKYNQIRNNSPEAKLWRKNYYKKNREKLLAYRNLPEVKEKIRKYLNEYYQRPYVIKKRIAYLEAQLQKQKDKLNGLI